MDCVVGSGTAGENHLAYPLQSQQSAYCMAKVREYAGQTPSPADLAAP